MYNIITFGRWYHADYTRMVKSRQEFESIPTQKNLQGLCTSLTDTRDLKYGSRYLRMDMPAYGDLLKNVKEACGNLIFESKRSRPNEPLAWNFQKTVAVAAQTLLPPMRGEPFWDLQLTDDYKNSMFFSNLR